MKRPIIELQNITKCFGKFKAVDRATFKIYEGESVGLWGENGSGKSTILKLIGGLYQPTKGKIRVSGKVAPVLELGVGLHPDLTGRENFYFYSSILNFSKEETKENYQKVIHFFGFENFIDIAVKKYSSGMRARLAFSIAVFSSAPILLLDEVMAVGDSDFQERALDLLRSLRGKKTLVFTTHSYSLAQQLGDRILCFRRGKLMETSRSINCEFLRRLKKNQEVKAEAMSNSMRPTIFKGDELLIKKVAYEKLEEGDIVAFLFTNLNQMIVHRIVAKRQTLGGETKIYTKGDFAYETDPWFLSESDYVGKVVEIKKPNFK